MELKLYGAGQGILKSAFSGNVYGMGPGVAEVEIEERGADPIVVFAADKTSAGSFNYPLFSIFADPMNTAGLVIDPHMICGFKFDVVDTIENKVITLKCPEETYELLALIGTVGRYAVSRIRRSDDLICASSSVSKLSLIDRQIRRKRRPSHDHPSPAWFTSRRRNSGSFHAHLLRYGLDARQPLGTIDAVGLKDSKCTAFDGPSRIVALGFQVSNGRIATDDESKPMIADLFDDPAFALAREEAVKEGTMLRRMGEFEPARLGPEEMEYTTIQAVLEKLDKRFTTVKGQE